MSANKTTGHKIVPVTIKGQRTFVDEGIKDLVMWMNSIDGVVTMYSCQGEFTENGYVKRPPYVMFECETKASLRTLSRYFNNSVVLVWDLTFNIDYDFNIFWGKETYCLRINDNEGWAKKVKDYDLNSLPFLFKEIANYLFDFTDLDVNANVFASLMIHESVAIAEHWEAWPRKLMLTDMHKIVEKKMSDEEKTIRNKILEEHGMELCKA